MTIRKLRHQTGATWASIIWGGAGFFAAFTIIDLLGGFLL